MGLGRSGGRSRRTKARKRLFFKDPNGWAYLMPQPLTYNRNLFHYGHSSFCVPHPDPEAAHWVSEACTAHLMPSAHLPFLATALKNFSPGSCAEEEFGVRQSWRSIPALPCPWGYHKVTKATQVSMATKVAAKGKCLIKGSRSLFLHICSTGITMVLT